MKGIIVVGLIVLLLFSLATTVVAGIPEGDAFRRFEENYDNQHVSPPNEDKNVSSSTPSQEDEKQEGSGSLMGIFAIGIIIMLLILYKVFSRKPTSH